MALFNLPALSILRLAQAVFALIALSLFAHLASLLNTNATRISTPSQLNFALFTAIYTLLVILPYTALAPRWFPKLAHRYAMMSAECSAGLFWFAAMVALADWVRKEKDGVKDENDDAGTWKTEKATAVAGTCFASFEFILFATSASFALSHLLSSAPLRPSPSDAYPHPHPRSSPSHHTQKASVSSVTKLLPPNIKKPTPPLPTATKTIHIDRSPKDPPYQRTQYRFDASARPLSFRSFKSVAAASKARSTRHFTLMREREDRERRAKKKKIWIGGGGGGDLNCGLGLLSGHGASNKKRSWGGEREWEKMDMDMDMRPNLVVVPARGNGPGWTRSDGGLGRDLNTTAPSSSAARPYSTKVMNVAGKVWDGVSEVVADVSARVTAASGSQGGHRGWFGYRAEGTTRSDGGWARVGIGNPDGQRRQWDGADVV